MPLTSLLPQQLKENTENNTTKNTIENTKNKPWNTLNCSQFVHICYFCPCFILFLFLFSYYFLFYLNLVIFLFSSFFLFPTNVFLTKSLNDYIFFYNCREEKIKKIYVKEFSKTQAVRQSGKETAEKAESPQTKARCGLVTDAYAEASKKSFSFMVYKLISNQLTYS